MFAALLFRVRCGWHGAVTLGSARKIDTIGRMVPFRTGRLVDALAQVLASLVLLATLLAWLVPAAQASAQCPDGAPLVRHGPADRIQEAESRVLLRHALVGSTASDAGAAADLPVHDAVRREELESVLARIRITWPDRAAITARSPWEPGTLILDLEPALGKAIMAALAARGASAPFCTAHAGFDILNRDVGLRAITAYPNLPNLVRIQFDPDRDVPGVGARYAALDGVVAAMPDAHMGDGPGIQALHANGDWFLVFRNAWGDCPSGCLFSELHFFVADENRVARIDSEDAARMEAFSDILAARGWRTR